MSLRCKPGDLAVIVKAKTDKHLIGAVRKLTVIDSEWPGFWNYEGERLYCRNGREIEALRDEYLRPIRDQPGEDETLRIAGRPLDIEHA